MSKLNGEDLSPESSNNQPEYSQETTESSSLNPNHPSDVSPEQWWPRRRVLSRKLVPQRVHSLQVDLLDLVETHKERFLGQWDYFILFLSFYTLAILIVQSLFPLPETYRSLFTLLDHGVCLAFMLDFFLRLYMASSKVEYLKWGWIDFISSLPQLEGLRWGRTLRLIRIIRAFRSMRFVRQKLTERLSDSFSLVLLISFVLITFGAMSILYLESPIAEGNIKTGEQALWWSFVTITTVGYGDFYPISTEGRLLAGILMSAGVGIFGVFTVKCTQVILSSSHEEDERHLNEIHDEIRSLRNEITELKALLLHTTPPSLTPSSLSLSEGSSKSSQCLHEQPIERDKEVSDGLSSAFKVDLDFNFASSSEALQKSVENEGGEKEVGKEI